MPLPSLLDVDVLETDTVTIVQLHGELDSTTTPTLLDVLESGVWSQRRVQLQLDLSDVTYINTTGLRALQSCHDRALAEGTECRMVVSPGRVRRTLEAAGLTEVFDIVYFRAGTRTTLAGR